MTPRSDSQKRLTRIVPSREGRNQKGTCIGGSPASHPNQLI